MHLDAARHQLDNARGAILAAEGIMETKSGKGNFNPADTSAGQHSAALRHMAGAVAHLIEQVERLTVSVGRRDYAVGEEKTDG